MTGLVFFCAGICNHLKSEHLPSKEATKGNFYVGGVGRVNIEKTYTAMVCSDWHQQPVARQQTLTRIQDPAQTWDLCVLVTVMEAALGSASVATKRHALACFRTEMIDLLLGVYNYLIKARL